MYSEIVKKLRYLYTLHACVYFGIGKFVVTPANLRAYGILLIFR